MISFVMSLVLLGGFYDWNVTITGICILAEILLFYQKKKTVYQRKRNYFMWLPVIMLIWMIVVTSWSLDTSENILGIIRGVVLLFWMYLCFQMEEEEKQRIFNVIPYLGAMMVGVGIVSLAWENIAAYFWQARRFGGCFQYPNTCALFLVIGLILQIEKMLQNQEGSQQKNSQKEINVLCFRKLIIRKNVISIAVLVVLIIGVFLTGCRSVLLLFLLWGIYRAIKIKKLRKPFFLVTIASFILAYVYGMIMGDHQNIARIFTIFQANSTIYGRILYGIDALSIAKSHPFGLGYMGYYFIQPAMQTGVYTTRFIHNDLLQVLVDYGIPAFVLLVIYLMYQLLKGRQSIQQKELLVLIVLASLADFHLQYMNLLMILVLCLDLGKKEGAKKRKEIRENYFFIGMGIVTGMYFTVAFGANYFGNHSLALELFPSYTEAQIEALQECSDKEEAVKLANDILSHNPYVSDAYHTNVYASVMERDFLQAMEYIDKSLELRRYDVESYQMYYNLFEEMMEMCDNMGMMQELEMLKLKREELPGRLAALEKETHPLAFKLRDKPQFMW